MRLTPAGLALALAGCAVLSSCGTVGSGGSVGTGGAPGTGGSPGVSPATGPRGTVTVLAAASLTEAFQRIEKEYEQAHPEVDVQISFAASSTIVAQVSGGAPADVVALAGEAAASPLAAQPVAGRSVIATNTLEIGVPQGNPSRIASLADLARPGLKVVLCASSVPCGAAADAALAKAHVAASVVSRETDVRATLTKVRLGEADAAIVYHSDVASAKGQVSGIPVPAEANQTLRYPLIWLNTRPTTIAFAAYVSKEGQKALQDNGFGMP